MTRRGANLTLTSLKESRCSYLQKYHEKHKELTCVYNCHVYDAERKCIHTRLTTADNALHECTPERLLSKVAFALVANKSVVRSGIFLE